jgi:DNA-binding response OmpR family regulator
LSEVAIRLADEGAIAAICRATKIPSDELREQLQAAQERGRLIAMPAHDWPPHDAKPRRTLADERDQAQVALRTVVGMTRTEAALLLEMLRQGNICRGRYASPGAIDVHVFNLRRRLAPHDIAIVSVHGHGYRLSPEDRERLLVMIEQARAAS